METRNLKEARRFGAEKLVKAGLFATDRLYYDLYCLEPGQSQKVHTHAESDKVYLTLAGRPTVTAGDEERALLVDECVLMRAGLPHGVRNDTDERAVLLVVTTPPPR